MKIYGMKSGAPGREIRNLLENLVLYERITTTLSNAKRTKRMFDRMCSGLDASSKNQRKLQKYLFTSNARKKVIEVLLPRLRSKNLPIKLVRLGRRLGDGSSIALLYVTSAKMKSQVRKT